MIQESIRQLCAVSLLCGAALSLTPDGGVKKVTQMLCTAVLTLAVLSPLRELDFDVYALETAKLREAEAGITANAEKIEDRLNRIVIERQCEEYIMDKAGELGLDGIDVKVQAQWSLEGLWVPYSAQIIAGADEKAASELAGIIRDDLGIPTERQQWCGEG